MSARFYVGISLLFFTPANLAGAPNDPPADTGQTIESAQPATPQPTAEVPLEEAVAQAIDALIQLAAAVDAESRSLLIEEVNRSIGIVESADADTPWLFYLHGRLYLHTGLQGDAVIHFRKFVETREGRNEWHAYQLLGDLFVEEFPRLAQANYEKAAALTADEPTVLLGLSRCAFKLGRFAEAARFGRRAMAADRESTIGYVGHLARMLMATREWDEAQRAAEKALHMAKEVVANQPGERAPLHVLDGSYKLMIEILTAQLPTITDTQRLADGYLRLAEYGRERADNGANLSRHDILDVLEHGVQRTAPKTPARLLERYAINLAEVGRSDDAISEFERLLELDPANTVAAEYLNRLRPGTGANDQPSEP